MKADSLFLEWPYMAAGLFCLGILFRYLLTREQIALVKVKLPESRAVFGGSALWRISLALLLLGHLAGLIFPHGILLWNNNPMRLYLLEGSAFVVGAVALGSWATLMWRHLERPTGSALNQFADTVFLALLFVGLASGLLMAIVDRWASSWGVMTFTPYAISLLRGKPSASFAAQMPFLARLHFFSWFAAIALVPITRVAPFLVLGLHRCIELMRKPASAAGRAAEAWMERHNVAARIWPEED